MKVGDASKLYNKLIKEFNSAASNSKQDLPNDWGVRARQLLESGGLTADQARVLKDRLAMVKQPVA